MKLKLIALAFTALASTAANAEITYSASGNGDLFFTAWDKNGTPDNFADDRSYTRDLGISMNDFASAATTPVIAADKETDGYLLVFAPDAEFLTFLAATAVSPSGVQWNIAAADSNGRDRALLTAKSIPGADEMQINTQFRNWATSADIFLAAVNPLGTHPTQEAGSSTATQADGGALASDEINWGGTWGQALNFDTSGMKGDSLNTYLFWEATTTSVGKPGVHEYANSVGTPATWTLGNDGSLTYAVAVAAVPEADTWAMMLAGLGLMGFIARRRLNG